MKKYIISIPIDIWILVGIAFICRMFSKNFGYFGLLILIIYLSTNFYTTQKKYGRFHFFLLYTPFFKKDQLYISMNKNTWEPNVGNHSIENASKSSVFMYEAAALLKMIPPGIKCTCYTHDKIIKTIDRNCTIIKKKPSYKGSLKKVMKYLGKKNNSKEKVQFYYVKFTTNH